MKVFPTLIYIKKYTYTHILYTHILYTYIFFPIIDLKKLSYFLTRGVFPLIYKAFGRMKVCFKSLTNFHTFLHFLLYVSVRNPSSVCLKNESEILLFYL